MKDNSTTNTIVTAIVVAIIWIAMMALSAYVDSKTPCFDPLRIGPFVLCD